MRTEHAVEVVWTCAACGAGHRSPWPQLIVVDKEDTWGRVRAAAELSCGECSARALHRRPTVLVDDLDDPDVVLAVGPPSAPPEWLRPDHRRLGVPLDWPTWDGAVLADPAVRSVAAAGVRRRKLSQAVSRVVGTSDPAELARHLLDHPDLRSADAVSLLDEKLDVIGLPPEARLFRQAFVEFFQGDPGRAADAAVRRFLVARDAGQTELGAAGLRQMAWLLDHRGDRDHPAWDARARTTLVLLGLAGRAAERAQLLFVVGTAVDGRARKSPEEIDWAIECLSDCYDLCIDMQDADNAARAAENLALALQSRRHGDLVADTQAATELLTSTLAYHESQGDWAQRAQTATNLAVTYLRLHNLTGSQSAVGRAVALCREALPDRPRSRDPIGWAYTASNLARALTLDDRNEIPLSDRLAEAAVLLREIWPMFVGLVSTMNSHKVRIDLCRVLLGQAALCRADRIHDRLAELLGRPADHLAFRAFQAMTANPAIFSVTTSDVPPELREVYHGTAGRAELVPLIEARALAEAGLEESRLVGDRERCGEYAQILAGIAHRVHGDSDEGVRRVAAARAQIDHRYAPIGAWETAADLAALHARRGEWPEARRAYDDCLDVRNWVLSQTRDRETTLRHLRRAPALAREAIVSRVHSGDVPGAVELAERSRLLSYAEISGDLRFGSAGLLRSASATPADIGSAATPDTPLVYLVTSAWGSVALLIRRPESRAVTFDAFPSPATSSDFLALFNHAVEHELGLMSAQRTGHDTGTAVTRMAGPLGRLLQPVVDRLRAEGIGRLLLVPTGPTSAYPWSIATVTDPVDGRSVALVDLFVLTQAPSAMAARYSRARAAAAVAGPDPRVVVFADPVRSDVGRLPGAQAEATAIADAFPGHVEVHAGPDATKARLLTELPDSWITHLACHGTNDWVEFASMRLLLTDGDLTLDDLIGLPALPGRLIFLSACQTGHADVRRLSDEMIGLPYSLLATGVAAVISTLWPVDDALTAALVGRFYTELAAGPDDPPAALRRAQLWLRDSGLLTGGRRRDLTAGDSTPHQHEWAAFVCHGV